MVPFKQVQGQSLFLVIPNKKGGEEMGNVRRVGADI